MQFKLDPEKVPELFQTFGLTWEHVQQSEHGELGGIIVFVDHIVVTTVKNTASQFSTGEFYTKRRAISSKIFEGLTKVLEPMGIMVFQFQLRNLALPEKVDEQVDANAVEWQTRKMAEFEQLTRMAKAAITVINRTAAADASVTIMGKQATGFLQYETVKAQMLEWSTYQETDRYKLLQAATTTPGDMTDRQLLYFQWLDAWRDSEADLLTLNTEQNLKLTRH